MPRPGVVLLSGHVVDDGTAAIALRLQPSAEPASYIEPLALLLHRWSAETGLVTHLVPIGTFPGPFSFA